MTADILPMELPTLPGKVHGIVGDNPPTVQCTRCLRTRSDPSWFVVARWALFPRGGRHDDRHRAGVTYAVGGERLCADCRKACGCEPCRRTL